MGTSLPLKRAETVRHMFTSVTFGYKPTDHIPMAHSHFWLCLTFHYFRLLREVRLDLHPINDRRVAELHMLPYKVLQSLRIL